ncbi:MAG: hypothetical protein WAN43_01600 [Rhodomicrobium sp.]|jgi:hypothetical protein
MRRYPALQNYDEREAPRLPFGYPAMLLIALVPPLWFRMMNPRVLDWHSRFWETGPAPSSPQPSSGGLALSNSRA